MPRANPHNTFFIKFALDGADVLQESFNSRISSSSYFSKVGEIKKQRDSNLILSLNFKDRQTIQKRDRDNTLELANYGRKLSGKTEFNNYDEYEDFVAEDEFIIDAEIDQSFRVLLELLEIES